MRHTDANVDLRTALTRELTKQLIKAGAMIVVHVAIKAYLKRLNNK